MDSGIRDALNELNSLNEERLVEMAIINPKVCKQLTVQIEIEQRDEGEIPHLHVYHDKTRNPRKCSYVRLDKAAYCEHHKDAPALPRKLKEEFVMLMEALWMKRIFVNPITGDHKIATGYEAAVDLWVDSFEDEDYSKFTFDDDNNIVMPDYEAYL